MATGFIPVWEISELKNKYKEIWEDTSDTFPDWQKDYSKRQQREKDIGMGSFADEVIRLVKVFPEKNGKDSEQWGTSLKKLIYGCGKDIMGFDDKSMKLLLEGGFCDVTSDFITEARKFDDRFKIDDIFQALRNVWIMNCLQFLMAADVEETPSVFAYSMLYPYTDNYLDTYLVSSDKKSQLNYRFRRRLAGEKIKADNEYENKLFRLVDIIEGQYDREYYPMVYKSLLDIHSAQRRSLQQHSGVFTGNYADILDISFEKGGTSVLADACLIKGSLSYEQASFTFGFGILLQLLDDLQDAAVDSSNGHITLLSGKNSGRSDKLAESYTNRLINFTWRVMDGDKCFTTPDAIMIKSMIKKSIAFMLLGAVASNSSLYSREYIKKLETFSPLSFGHLKKFYRRIGKEYCKLKIKLSVKPMEVPMAKAFAAGVL